MSDANLEVVRGLFEAFDRGALDEASAFLDPQVEWDNSVLLDEPVIQGGEAVLAYWERILSTFPFLHEQHRYELRGERVCVLARIAVRGASSGAALGQDVGYVVEVHDGLVTKARFFASPGRALKALEDGS